MPWVRVASARLVRLRRSASFYSIRLGLESQHVDQRLKCRRLMTSARIVHEGAIERRAPVLEYPHERAIGDVLRHVLLEHESQSQSVQRGTERERGVAEDEGPRDGHRDGVT